MADNGMAAAASDPATRGRTAGYDDRIVPPYYNPTLEIPPPRFRRLDPFGLLLSGPVPRTPDDYGGERRGDDCLNPPPPSSSSCVEVLGRSLASFSADVDRAVQEMGSRSYHRKVAAGADKEDDGIIARGRDDGDGDGDGEDDVSNDLSPRIIGGGGVRGGEWEDETA